MRDVHAVQLDFIMMRRMQILSVFAAGDSNRYVDIVDEARMPKPRGGENHQLPVLRTGLA